MQRLHKLLIAGLGNVGGEYAYTRHNIGFDVVDAWAEKQGMAWQNVNFGSLAHLKYRGVDVHILKPNTYMNVSGKAIKHWLGKLQMSPSSLLVVVDDMAFEVGDIKLRMQGNHGGHNGLRSIQDELNTAVYARLRCGIGRNFGVGQQSNYVLGKWTEAERPLVTQMIERSGEAINAILKSNLQLAMNEINGK